MGCLEWVAISIKILKKEKIGMMRNQEKVLNGESNEIKDKNELPCRF